MQLSQKVWPQGSTRGFRSGSCAGFLHAAGSGAAPLPRHASTMVSSEAGMLISEQLTTESRQDS